MGYYFTKTASSDFLFNEPSQPPFSKTYPKPKLHFLNAGERAIKN